MYSYSVCDTCVHIRRGARQARQAWRIKRGAKLDKGRRVGDHEGRAASVAWSTSAARCAASLVVQFPLN